MYENILSNNCHQPTKLFLLDDITVVVCVFVLRWCIC